MSRRADDEEHSTFIRLEGLLDGQGDEPVVSMAALQLHAAGIVNSARDGHPGFVSDDYLSAIAAETSITATELCTAGMWRRVEGGYEVLDREAVDLVVRQNQRRAEPNDR
jgi:hypothetical protein